MDASINECLVEAYRKLELVDAKGIVFPLFDICPKKVECWTGLSQFPGEQSEEDYAGVTLPWIGPYYKKGGLMVLPMNFNDMGGLHAWDVVVARTLAELPWKDKVLSGSKYGGNLVYQRMGWYAAVILRHRGVPEFQDDLDVLDWCKKPTRNERIRCAFSWFACANRVKCSPCSSERPRSNPTDAMLRNCPPYVLAEELEILQPGVLLVLGNTNDLAKVGGLSELTQPKDGVSRATLQTMTRTYQVIAMPHPAGHYHGENSLELVSQLDEALSVCPLP